MRRQHPAYSANAREPSSFGSASGERGRKGRGAAVNAHTRGSGFNLSRLRAAAAGRCLSARSSFVCRAVGGC
eukprot:1731634-Alexandrium_andersonii.AAC.1